MHQGGTGAHLVGYVTLDHTTTGDHDAELVEEWQHMYDDLYGAEVEASGFGMDFRGWNSSYTGDPIPLEEMAEWRAATGDRSTHSSRGGCWRSARARDCCCRRSPRSANAMSPPDMSAVAIDNLARSLEQLQIPWRDRVQLLTQPAHVTDAPPQGYFDTVIMTRSSSTSPNAGYLADLIDNAMGLLAPGGSLFIGDVRNHALQGAFQTAVALARTTTADAAEVRQRVHRAIVSEPELLLAPEFFTTWAADHWSVAEI